MLEVIDNFLPQSYQDELEEVVTRYDFPWYYQPLITTGKPKIQNEQFQYCHGFTHQFYNAERGVMSASYGMVQSFLHFVPQEYKVKGYYRLVANLTVPVQNWTKDTVQEPHVDMPIPHLVCLYFINDTDGDTFFFDQFKDATEKEPEEFTIHKRIKPKKGRAVIFDGLRYHAGNCPIENQTRLVINAGLVI